MIDDDSEVGYKRPPRHSRFKPGQSGNPKGRPKGALGFNAIIQRELRRRVTIKENGRSRAVSMYELLVKSILNRAVQGDARYMEIALSLCRAMEASLPPQMPERMIIEFVRPDGDGTLLSEEEFLKAGS